MKLPPDLPPLRTPHFILRYPAVWQWAFLAVGILLPLASFGWLLARGLSAGFADGLAGEHWAAAGVMLLLFALALLPRNRHVWVVFAADPAGIYLATLRDGWVHVPWADVGPSAIGVAGAGSNRARMVILRLRVDDAAWAALVGGRRRRADASTDEEGYRQFGIGSTGRDVEDTRRQIERLRPPPAAA